MAELQARLAAASTFILQSPPGEVNDVFNDVRALVGDDEALESGILPALEKYNVEQFIVAGLPDKQQLLICQAGAVASSSNRYIEPRTAKAWTFDHLRLTASDPIDIQVDEDCEGIRKELEKSAEAYGKEHFSEGVSKVFTTEQTKLKKEAKKPKSLPATSHAAGRENDTEAKEMEIQQAADSDVADPVLEQTPAKLDVENAVPTKDGNAEAASAPALAIEENGIAQTATENQDSEMTSAPTPAPAETPEDADMEGTTPAPVSQEETTTLAAVEEEVAEPIEPLPKKFSLFFVGNKYNPQNYWTGRWRSSYVLDLTSSSPTLTGSIQLNVHFFEQGNVQLSASHTPTVTLPSSINASSQPAELAKAVVKAISKAEEEYQLELNEAYREMSEKTFKSLRRALPITRQKLDWNKVANYKLGRDLGGASQ